MAGKTLGISFLIGASVGASVSRAFSSVNEKLRAAQASFREASRKSRQLSEAQTLREKRDALAARAGESLRATGRIDDSLSRELKKISLAYAQAAKAAGVYGQGLEEIRRRQSEAARSVEAGRRRLANLARIQGARDALQNERGARAGALGEGAALVARAAAFAAPLKIGADFEAAMSRVAAVSGAVGEDFARLRAQARELGASTVWSAKEAAEGMTFLAMAGFKTEETLSAMPGMLSLASAGGMDLAATADIASNILSGFGFEAKRMDYVANVMAKTFTSSNTSIASLGESFKYCGPAAKAAGQSFQDVAAMIGKLGDAGVPGSMAGSGLAAIISRLAKPPKEAAAALEKLGVSIVGAGGKMRPMGEIFADVEAASRSFGEAERVALAKALYGAEHFSKGFVLQAAAASGSLKKLSESLDEEGYAQKVAQGMNDNFIGDLKALDSACQEAGITLYDAVNPALRAIAQNIIPIVQATGRWIGENPRLAQGLFMLGGAFATLKAGSLVFSLLNSYRRSFGAGLVALRGQAQEASLGVTGAFSRMRAELSRPVSLSFAGARAQAESFRARLAALSASARSAAASLGRISPAAALAGAGAAASGAMAATGRAGFNALKLSVRGVGMAFKTMFGPMSLAIMGISLGAEWIMENWEKIQPFFETLWEGVKSVFSAVMGWLEPIIDAIMGAIGPVISGVKSVGSLIGKGWDALFGEDEAGAVSPAPAQKAAVSPAPVQKAAVSPAPAREAAVSPAPVAKAAVAPARPADFAKISAAMAESGDYGEDYEEDYAPPQIRPARAASRGAQGAQGGRAAAPGTQIVQPQIQVELSVTQNGIPEADFASGVINAIKAKKGELEAMISAIVNEQARLAYG